MSGGAKVAVVGAGSLRCGAAALAGVFNCRWPQNATLCLCDPHAEALDLFDRLARTFADVQQSNMAIQATDSLEEAMEGATSVVLCFGLGHAAPKLRQWAEQTGVSPDSRAASFGRAIVLNRIFEAVNDLLHRLEDAADVVNLVSPTALAGLLLAYEAIHLDWPPKLGVAERVAAPHQALRWIRGEESPLQELREHAESPLVTALMDRKPRPENRFDAKALAGWIAELEAKLPGCREQLLAMH